MYAWEPMEDRPIAQNSSFKNTQDGNDFGEGKRYFEKMSPGYDGMGLRNYNEAHGYDQSHFQRTRNRSRSPMNARLSSRWIERRSVPEKSSQICRNLSAGGCRRGSQCRFFHPNTTKRIPRQFYSGAPSGFRPLCKFFAAGMCKYRENCRFSHADGNTDRRGEAIDRRSRDKDTWQVSSCNDATKISETNGWRAEDTERCSHEFGSWLGNPIRDIETKIPDSGNRQSDRISEDRNKNWGITESTLPIPFSGHNPNNQMSLLRPDVLYEVKETPHILSEHETSQPPRFLEADLANLLAKKLSDQAAALSRSFVNREHPQTYAETPSFPDNSVWAPPVIAQPRLGTVTPDPYSMENGRKNAEHDNLSTQQGTKPKQLSPLFDVGPPGFNSIKVRSEDVAANSEVKQCNTFVAEESKGVEEIKEPETQNVDKKIEVRLDVNKEEKSISLFKNSLVQLVKGILKPAWKEGQMSRDDHKVVVRKVVDKVSSTVHTDHIPKTQEKVSQYLASSKPKITKLVQAYVERSLKKKS